MMCANEPVPLCEHNQVPSLCDHCATELRRLHAIAMRQTNQPWERTNCSSALYLRSRAFKQQLDNPPPLDAVLAQEPLAEHVYHAPRTYMAAIAVAAALTLGLWLWSSM